LIASESGHWYDRTGAPCYTVNSKNGTLRGTTLRDARILKLVPSVTEVMKVLAKPGLERWKLEQVKLACLTLPKIDGETLDQFSDRIYRDANQQVNDACRLGTEIHGAIEAFYQGKVVRCHKNIVHSLADKLQDEFGPQLWLPEKSFSHPLGYGGKVDLHSLEWVIDYKTKDFEVDDLKTKFSYNEHILQLSAYRTGLCLPYAGIASVFISRTNPGLIKVEKHDLDFSNQFKALLRYWQYAKTFDSCY